MDSVSLEKIPRNLVEVCVIGEFRGNLPDRIGRVSRALSNPSISLILAQSFEEECKEEIPRMDLSNLGDVSNGLSQWNTQKFQESKQRNSTS